jgi:hypothetical protein
MAAARHKECALVCSTYGAEIPLRRQNLLSRKISLMGYIHVLHVSAVYQHCLHRCKAAGAAYRTVHLTTMHPYIDVLLTQYRFIENI